MAEWSNVPDSKSGVGASLPWVRIPPSPPTCQLFKAIKANWLTVPTGVPTFVFTLLFAFPNFGDKLLATLIADRRIHNLQITSFLKSMGIIRTNNEL